MSVQTDIEDAASAREDILEDGQLVTWYKRPDAPLVGKSWEDADTVGAGLDTPYTNTPILFIPMNRVDFETLRDVKGTEVGKRYEQALMPGDVPFIPAIDDYCITGAGVRYSLVNYDEIAPSGTKVLYIMQLST